MATRYTNARVLASSGETKSSFAVRDGKFCDDAEVQPGDAEVDLGGRFVMPSFVDAHCHLLLLGESVEKVDLEGCNSLDAILQRLDSHDRDAPRIMARNWVPSMTRPEEIHRRFFDKFSKPVYIEAADLHSGVMNSAALKELGVDRDTADPSGGQIVRDSDGHATGWLKEMAWLGLVLAKFKSWTKSEQKQARMERAYDMLLEAGYTGVADLLMDEDGWEVITALLERDGRLPLRTAVYWHCPPQDDVEKCFKDIERASALQKQYRGNEWLQVNGIKIVCDGVIDSCTAALLLPYQDGTSADPLWSSSHLDRVVQRASDRDLQCAVHAIGDLSVRLAVNAFALLGDAAVKRHRHRIEHLELSAEEDVRRLGELGITTSVQPFHSDPAILDNWHNNLGRDSSRCCRAFAYRDFLESGAPMAIGTDGPTAPIPPLHNLHLATTRKSPSQPQREPTTVQFALPVIAALAASTDGAARACHLDDRLGAIEAGRSADFNVIDVSLLEEGRDVFMKAAVEETYREGRLVVSKGRLQGA